MGYSYQPAVTSISKTGDVKLTGDVTLTAGANITLTESGQDITIASTGGSTSATRPFAFFAS